MWGYVSFYSTSSTLCGGTVIVPPSAINQLPSLAERVNFCQNTLTRRLVVVTDAESLSMSALYLLL